MLCTLLIWKCAFVLMTLVVSGVFSLSIVAIVHFVEEHLVSQELDRELSIVIEEDLRRGERPRLDSSTRFSPLTCPNIRCRSSSPKSPTGFPRWSRATRHFICSSAATTRSPTCWWRNSTNSRHDMGQLFRHRGGMPMADWHRLLEAYS